MGFLDTINYVEMICGECGIVFHIPAVFQKERKELGKGWHCPNGHPRVYRETDVDRLEREVSKERNLRLHFERKTEEAEKALSRIKKRVHAGICPECNRTFSNLAAHMKTKHSPQLKKRPQTPKHAPSKGQLKGFK